MKRLFLLLCGMALAAPALPAAAQTIVDLGRPRVAVAADGSFAIAREALVQDINTVWKVLVQRYARGGAPVGPLHVFEGESCQSLVDIWLSDFQEHIELAFRSDGILLVLMQHTGELQIGGDGRASSEVTFGAIATDGSLIDLNQNTTACVQQKEVFVGGGRQDRPRMALAPNDVVYLTADGFFQGADSRNVTIRVLDPNLAQVQGLDEVIPHADAGSTQRFHAFPDIATNGTLLLSTWHECPMDNQGNALECDIGAQFAQITGGGAGLQAVGGNRIVNAGDPAGTFSIFPAAAMNAGGAGVIVWADTRNGFAGDIYGQRFDASGQPVGGNIAVSTGQGEIYFRPEVALLDNGGFVVAWTDSAAAGFSARLREFDPAGAPLGPPVRLGGGFPTGTPHVATDGNAFFYTYLGRPGGSLELFSNTPSLTSGEPVDAPAEAVLSAFPNPFGARGEITYRLEEPGRVRLALYDVLGREVYRVVDAPRASGTHRVRVDGAWLPPGLYLIRLEHGGRAQTRTWIRAE